MSDLLFLQGTARNCARILILALFLSAAGCKATKTDDHVSAAGGTGNGIATSAAVGAKPQVPDDALPAE